jgi:hypothetical protein
MIKLNEQKRREAKMHYFSPRYKKMCEKAKEIQKKPDEFQREADYVYHPGKRKEGIN